MAYRIDYSPDAEDHLRALATWELRVGNLRVYYDVQDTPEAVVFVRAVGIKLRRRVRFGKEVIDL